MLNIDNPQITLIKIAVESSRIKTGTINVNAKTNLDKKVEIVDSHISLVVCLLSDSSETWIPNASENASAIAIVKIPPITTKDELVLECRPIINPSVVIIPDVTPKLRPTFIECFTFVDISF